MRAVARKTISDTGIGALERSVRARDRKRLPESMEPLRLRGRREFVTAMVDALNDILATERRIA